MLTVREAMKTGGLSKCRLLAGEAGLDNAITCVDCMEVPNIEPWLRSGELLITTGYALRDDENAILYLLETLTKGKAAALAIKTRFLGELKDTDIALAQRLGLPLFEMPSDMPTTEMVMPVVRMLTNRQVEIMEFSEKIHKRFTEIELSDGGFGKIAAVLSKLLQMPAAIVDGAGEILAASHIPDNFEDLEDYILQEVLGQGSAAERCPREARGYTVFSRSVTVREAVRGYMLVFCPVAALNEMQMIILDHSVTAAALEFSKRDSIRDNVNQLNTALFLDLVLRNISTHKELTYRTEELNWPRPPLAMICMDICSFKKAIAGLSEQDILEKKFLVSECLRTYMPQSVVVSQSDSFVCIFPEYAQSKEVLNAINTSCSQIKELTGFSFTISVINHISDYLDLADAYTEERSMVDIARIIGKSGQIFFAGDLIKEQAYRHCVDNPYIRSYYQDTLEILRRYDAENDASLTETLEVYTSCLGIKTKAAETMGLHRNTLSFRLRRIEALLGLNLDDPETILFLHMVFHISRFF